MLEQIHFLLTYTCNYECDHCFLYCSPRSSGTFTLARVKEVLLEAQKTGTVKTVYFEGGEPLLFFPLLTRSIEAARDLGFSVGLVSNGYMSTSIEDAELWIGPLIEAGLNNMSLSDDDFHGQGQDSPAKRALAAAQNLGLAAGAICIGRPAVLAPGEGQVKGAPVIGGGAMFRGRAVEKLAPGLPQRDWSTLAECPHEELVAPERVHVDWLGNVHLCQGLIMGNMWETPLAELIGNYRAQDHPVCGPLTQGGPAELVRRYNLPHEDGYVDECHLCFMARKALLNRFPRQLGPENVYGLEG